MTDDLWIQHRLYYSAEEFKQFCCFVTSHHNASHHVLMACPLKSIGDVIHSFPHRFRSVTDHELSLLKHEGVRQWDLRGGDFDTLVDHYWHELALIDIPDPIMYRPPPYYNPGQAELEVKGLSSVSSMNAHEKIVPMLIGAIKKVAHQRLNGLTEDDLFQIADYGLKQ